MFPLVETFKALKKANLLSLMVACATLAVVVVFVAVVVITWITAYFIAFDTGWIDTLFTWVIGIITGIGGWFMLPALTVLIAGIFQEKVIYRVEQYYYSDSSHSESLKFWPDFWHDIKFTFWALFLNLLVLPSYFLGIGFVISIILNSYLLGHEFFESSAGYHLGKSKARELGKQNPLTVYGGGLAITLMTLAPVLNMFVPIIAIVWMVHVYHGIKRQF
jgi:CysZ protein